MQGNAGVDIFLVLTGLWATLQLVPALQLAAMCGSTSWSAVKQYYRKRVLRVLPPYATALALMALAIDHTRNADPALQRNHDTVFEYCPTSLPLNFVLANNVVGFGGCGVVSGVDGGGSRTHRLLPTSPHSHSLSSSPCCSTSGAWLCSSSSTSYSRWFCAWQAPSEYFFQKEEAGRSHRHAGHR